MGLNDTPNANRTHIGFFGMRNAGKSSLVNAVTGQNIAVVSDEKGTTTDPVFKAMELLPLGPVSIIDTPGFDDSGKLGDLRVIKTKQVLNKTDIAVLVVNAALPLSDFDNELLELFKKKNIPYIISYNKVDLAKEKISLKENEVYTNAITGEGVHLLKEKLATLFKPEEDKFIVSDLISEKDFVLLVVPIDSSAPKGRLILPQQQTIREILDKNATAVVIKETEIKQTLDSLLVKPKMVICDSQVFKIANETTPEDIPLTSFSILMSRFKGFLEPAVRGVSAIKNLKDGDTVVISEGCSHHRQCEDIGTVKIPRMLKEFTKKDLNFKFTSGTEFLENLSSAAIVIHCGGCMLNQREMLYRLSCAEDAGVPFTNYGIALSYMQGILKRSISVFPELSKLV